MLDRCRRKNGSYYHHYHREEAISSEIGDFSGESHPSRGDIDLT